MPDIVEVPRGTEGLSRMKWEYELARTGDSELLCFGTADMDFRSPEPILEALSGLIARGHLGYPYIPETYYQTIHDWLMRAAGWVVNVKTCTANNVGIYPAVWALIDALTMPGDEIIYQSPVHFCFREMIVANDRVAVPNPLCRVRAASGEDSYTMDFDQLESCFTEKTRIVWICNPHNPVGRAWNREELTRLGEICARHDVLIVSDDVYCGLLYPGTRYVPVASLSPELSARCVTCYSPSKSYNTTGMKYAFIITENPELLRKYLGSLHRLDLDYGFNTFGIAATTAAYGACDSWLESLMAYVGENLALVRACVQNEMPNVRLSTPDSTYFAWLDFSCLQLPPEELAAFFETKARVLIANGAPLGPGGEHHIRLNLGCTHDTLRAGLSRIAAAYQARMKSLNG